MWCRCILRYCHAHDRIAGVQDKITVFYRVENKEQVSSNRRLHSVKLKSCDFLLYPRLI